MDELTDTASHEMEDLQDDIVLHEGLLASLEGDDTETEDTKRVMRRTLKKLRKRLRSLQTPLLESPDVQQTTQSQDADQENSSSRFGHLDPGSAFNLVSRKRQRDEEEDDVRQSKSIKPTPSPSTTGRPSPNDSAGSFDSLEAEDIGDFTQEKGSHATEFLKALEERKRQEEEDAELARLIEAEWNQDMPNLSQKPSLTSSSSFTQSFFKPDGTIKRRIHSPAPTQSPSKVVKPEAASRPTISSNSSFNLSAEELREISANEFIPRQGTHGQRSVPGTADSSQFTKRTTMPGAFPGSSQYGLGGTSVYGTQSQPGSSRSFMPHANLLDSFDMFLGATRSGAISYPFGPHDMSRDASVDPAQTQEEIKNLLKHIRPDEELTPEQRAQIPKGLKAILMPHQAAGLAWMKKMEDSDNKGGILADDMGLGKTLQSISLILSRPPAENDQRPTLVVAPVALMQQWKRELEKMVRSSHKLNVFVLHGSARPVNYSAIRNYDVVLTTYGLLASELKKRLRWDEKVKMMPDVKPSPKEECIVLGDRSKFHRVILDEAQNIKNRNTKTAIAACRINSTYRWCLSGTPMQNNVEEMYSLIKFCRIRPYNVWEKFAKDFSKPLKARWESEKEKAMRQLQVLLRAILLRRTKTSKIDGKPILQLPEKHTVEDHAVFSKDELDFYKALEAKAQVQFNKYLQNGRIGRNYSHALVLLLRLRQACCHPNLVTRSKDFLQGGNLEATDYVENAKELSDEVVQRLKDLDSFECPVCMDAVDNPAIFQCGHALCNECLARLCDQALANQEGSQASCPHCRAKIDANKCTDLVSFLRVHCPDREGVEPLEEEISDSDTTSSEEEEDEEDEGEDLNGLIVPDDVETDPDSASDYEESDQKLKAEKSRKKIAKSKAKQKSNGKEKETPKYKSKSLADLRKEGLRNKESKRKYLKKLAKDWQTSAKIDKTLEILQTIKDRGENEKTIVFSSFTSFLDLLEVPLFRQTRLDGHTRYDGSMSPRDRNEAVLKFTDDSRCNIILVSLKAGNAGLNLTAANHVIILDPFWNPFVEYQAADRCYRIGQQREVTIHRIIIGEEGGQRDPEKPFTVEDRILKLQEKKKLLVETALDESAGQNVSRLGVRELGYLFGLNSLN